MKESAFCLAFVLMLSTCKAPIVPPDNWPPEGRDTTGHTFTWQIDTLGDGNSSVLNDVYIIDEDNIWAVGEIYLRDSSGQFDPLPYNAATWNGIKWNLRRITVDYNGNQISPPLEGVVAFSPTDIWLVGSFPIHGDGTSWTFYHLQDMGLSVSVSKAWGENSSNIYFVGTQGSIARFDGVSWQQLSSGTTTYVNDVYGTVTLMGDIVVVYCAVSDLFNPMDKKILRITNGSTVDSVSWNADIDVYAIWTENGLPLFAGGGGLWENGSGNWKGINLGTNSAIGAIRGNGLNDIFVVGAFGYFAHYNGINWHNYSGLGSFTHTRVSVKENTVVVVGQTNSRAVVTIGRR